METIQVIVKRQMEIEWHCPKCKHLNSKFCMAYPAQVECAFCGIICEVK